MQNEFLCPHQTQKYVQCNSKEFFKFCEKEYINRDEWTQSLQVLSMFPVYFVAVPVSEPKKWVTLLLINVFSK
jgi:hypothetical protein